MDKAPTIGAPNQRLGRRRIRRGWAVAVIFAGLTLFLALFVTLLIPLLSRQVPQFAGALPGYLDDLQRRDDRLGGAFRHTNVSARGPAAMRWKPALNAVAITFSDRFPAAETY